jgi:hypothetical protein
MPTLLFPSVVILFPPETITSLQSILSHNAQPSSINQGLFSEIKSNKLTAFVLVSLKEDWHFFKTIYSRFDRWLTFSLLPEKRFCSTFESTH